MVILLMPIFPVSPNCSEGAAGRGEGAREGQRGEVGRAGHASLITILPYYFFTAMAGNNTTPLPNWVGYIANHLLYATCYTISKSWDLKKLS